MISSSLPRHAFLRYASPIKNEKFASLPVASSVWPSLLNSIRRNSNLELTFPFLTAMNHKEGDLADHETQRQCTFCFY